MVIPGRVSVLLPTYNHAPFISDCINSVLDQSYRDVEIIVSDDASTDGNQEVIRALASEHSAVIPLFSEKNTGIASNLNRAHRKATGEYIVLFAGDDVMLPGKLAAQIAFLQRHPECAMCTHDVEVFDSTTNEILYRGSDRYEMKSGGVEVMFSVKWFLGRPMQYMAAPMVRGIVMPPHGFDERLRLANEWLLHIEVLTRGSLGYIPEVLARRRAHPNQVSVSPDAKKIYFEETMIVLAILSVRHPQLADLIGRKRKHLLFQNLVFDWTVPEKRRCAENQFRREAGLTKWLYMRVVRFLLSHKAALEATRSARRAVRAVVGDL